MSITSKVIRKCSVPEMHSIGAIAANFGNLELYIELAIWQLLKLPKEEMELGHAVTVGMSFQSKVHALASMYRLRFPEEEETVLKDMVADLFRVEDKRNAIVHSTWFYSEDNGQFGRFKSSARAKQGLKTRVTSPSTDELLKAVEDLEEVSQKFDRFARERIQDRLK